MPRAFPPSFRWSGRSRSLAAPFLASISLLAASCAPDDSGPDPLSGSASPSGGQSADGPALQIAVVTPPISALTNCKHQAYFAAIPLPSSGCTTCRYAWTVDGNVVQASSGEPGPEICMSTTELGIGTHAVRVRVSDDRGESATVAWELQVPDGAVENRPPWILQPLPPGDFALAPGETGNVRITAADVDVEDSPEVRWRLDGDPLPDRGDEVRLDSTSLSAGEHVLEVELSDGHARAAGTAALRKWIVRILESGPSPPRIVEAWPRGNPRLETGGPVRFRVAVAGGDWARVACRWEVDGVAQAETGEAFELRSPGPEGGGIGFHRVSCSLSGEGQPGGPPEAESAAAAVVWVLSVEPARTLPWTSGSQNRPPIVLAADPEPVVTGDPGSARSFRIVAFDPDGDVLTYRWRVAGAEQPVADPVLVYGVGEIDLDGQPLRVEVQASDGRGGEVGPESADADPLGSWELRRGEERGGGAAVTLSAGAVIRDNGQTGTSSAGIWNLSGAASPYGGSSLYSKSTDGTYRYDLALPGSGQYEVLLWWTSMSSRPPAAPVEIVHASGTATVSVDQRVAGGQWNRVGAWSFGSTARVTIRSVDSRYSTCADAVCLNPTGTTVPGPAPGEIILDDGSSGTSAVGNWSPSSAPGPYGGRSLYAKVSGSYTFSRSLSSPATFDVYAWWTQWSSRERAVPHEIRHSSGTATVYVDQTVRGGQWNLLGRYSFGSSASVAVRVVGSGSVCADAVRFVPASGSTGQTVQRTVAWDPPTTNADGTTLRDLAGYRLYWGTKSGSYGNSADAGLQTSRTVSLTSPGTYYFAVRAYDTSGNQSGYSREMTLTLP